MQPVQLIQEQICELVIKGVDARDRGDHCMAANAWNQAITLYENYERFIGSDMMSKVIPNDMIAGVYFDYGSMIESRGDVAGACEATRKAAKLNPNEPGFLQQLGRYCGRLGMHEEAVKAHQAYLNLVPDAEDASEVQTAISYSLSILKGEYQDKQPSIINSNWSSRYNAAVQLFETGNFLRAKDFFLSLLEAKDLRPVDEFMCRVSICQCVLGAKQRPSIKECVQRLVTAEFDEVEEHLLATRRLKNDLSNEERSQPAVSSSLELQDSIGYWITAVRLKQGNEK